MKEKLSAKELVLVASMLFGMFFGAGNLIFPVYMGQMAGSNVWQAIVGFIITGVGLPLLGVAALGLSRRESLFDLSCQVGRRYGLFFTCVLYLTIGPCFAIPRCATVSFTVGAVPLLENGGNPLYLGIFSLVFFALTLALSFRPSKILTWVGKVLNPVFLVFLGILVVKALLSPMAAVGAIPPEPAYETGAFFTGFQQGYQTMDALAGLAFGIVVVNAIRELGISKSDAVARNTVFSGVFSCLLMALIYLMVTVVGAQSRGVYPLCENGGEALALIADHYFGSVGAILLAVTVTLACLKTAVGLVTSCSEAFVTMFPKGPKYPVWAVTFSVVSFLIANLGLSAIIEYAVPVLMFLYPLAITLILLALFGRFFDHDQRVYGWVTGLTLVAALMDFLAALPAAAQSALHLAPFLEVVNGVLPFFSLGFGWICPALLGLVIGLIHRKAKKRPTAA
ncbi:MAG: branched-chain amino acid transport system II carrier protein [Bacillota bacterium]|nr:branched-chain amino acid transport system II carrier protein [Bacillota bacterium]